MRDECFLTPEHLTFPTLPLATTAEEIAHDALLPFATLCPSERWLQEILAWAQSQPNLHSARYCYELGRRLLQDRRFRPAWPALESALTICQRQEPPATSLSGEVLAALGELLDDIVEKPGAAAYLGRALVVWRGVCGPKHPEVGEILNNLGYWYRRSGRLSEARDCYEEALAIWRQRLGSEHVHVAAALNNLATVAREAGELEKARHSYRQALAINRAVRGPTHATTGVILANLGAACREDGEEENAEQILRRAVSILETASTEAPLELAAACNNMGHLLLGRGEHGEARRFLKRALMLYEETGAKTPLEVASVLHNLGTLYCATGNLDSAVSALSQARELRCRRLGAQHPRVRATSRILNEALAISGQRFAHPLNVTKARLN